MRGGCELKFSFDLEMSACRERNVTPIYYPSEFFLAAPECFRGEYYNEKFDVYSYMVIMWQIFVRKQPYFYLDFRSFYEFSIFIVYHDGRLKKVAEMPKLMDDLFDQGIKNDGQKRPSMKMILDIMRKVDSIINKKELSPIT
jgi:hypothetical protein